MHYTEENLNTMRRALQPGVEKATLLAAMQIEEARKLVNAQGDEWSTRTDRDQLVLAVAQMISTNWTGLE